MLGVFSVQSSGFRAWGLGFRVGAWGSRFRIIYRYLQRSWNTGIIAGIRKP